VMRIQLRTFLVLTIVAGVFIQCLRPAAAQSRALFAAADGGDQGKDWSASRRGEKCGCCAVDIRIKNRGGVNIY
jgi:hypothetical protein